MTRGTTVRTAFCSPPLHFDLFAWPRADEIPPQNMRGAGGAITKPGFPDASQTENPGE
jgi:hypothetical protein